MRGSLTEAGPAAVAVSMIHEIVPVAPSGGVGEKRGVRVMVLVGVSTVRVEVKPSGESPAGVGLTGIPVGISHATGVGSGTSQPSHAVISAAASITTIIGKRKSRIFMPRMLPMCWLTGK